MARVAASLLLYLQESYQTHIFLTVCLRRNIMCVVAHNLYHHSKKKCFQQRSVLVFFSHSCEEQGLKAFQCITRPAFEGLVIQQFIKPIPYGSITSKGHKTKQRPEVRCLKLNEQFFSISSISNIRNHFIWEIDTSNFAWLIELHHQSEYYSVNKNLLKKVTKFI